jgi:hypothetical protein
MNPKYKNIFWHQGIKEFSESLLKTESGKVKIHHLENDVTKALLNLFDLCDPKVLGAFLKLINIKETPRAFELEFQITDNQTYHQRRNRVFLAITTASTKTVSAPSYNKALSRPDACIHSVNTAILIEAKTQSPLIKEQNESHIKHFFGTATVTHRVTWERISARLKLLKDSLKGQDSFLVSQFCDFLDLIGISEFDGFNKSDFEMLGSIGKVTTEDFIDFKRIFLKKIDKFMNLLKKDIEPIINTDKFKEGLNSPGVFSAFYFYDDGEKTHINKYPNLNFIYDESGIQFTITGEVKSSLKMILKSISDHPKEFAKIADKLGEFNFFLYYKLQFAPMDNFIWNLVPGFPKKMGTFNADDITFAIKNFEREWVNFKNTTIFQMKSNVLKHYTDRYFNDKEIGFAVNKNPKPHFAIRIGRKYNSANIENLGKKIVPHFKKEISKLNNLIDLLRP